MQKGHYEGRHRKEDVNGPFRGLVFALPIGLVIWAFIIWGIVVIIK